MKLRYINKSSTKLRVLIAPLDWGLGHATRCIPIIYTLLALDVEVIVAANGNIKKLLQTEFNSLIFLDLNGYNITYQKKKGWFLFKIFIQFPKIIASVIKEHFWLKNVIKKYNFNAVISDNRLGFFTQKVPCIYITHQLNIITKNKFVNKIFQKGHYFFINKYTSCWVPDNKINNQYAGVLSHPPKTPKISTQYIGTLSRFEKIEVEKKYNLTILLSGPEPQRSIFENVILNEIKFCKNQHILIVRGLPNNEDLITSEFAIIKNHLNAKELNVAILQSEIIICRSGYTTIMDLVKLQKNAIFVPTPNQPEQEYLAKYLHEKKLFLNVSQTNFCLSEVLTQYRKFSVNDIEVYKEKYKPIVKRFIETI